MQLAAGCDHDGRRACEEEFDEQLGWETSAFEIWKTFTIGEEDGLDNLCL